MLKAYIRMKQNGVPILGRREIDDLGERILRDYDPALLERPKALRIHAFAHDYMHAPERYLLLSSSGTILGAAVFRDLPDVLFEDLLTGSQSRTTIPAGTILLDARLKGRDENTEHLCRFTAAHECGHLYLHRRHAEISPSFYNRTACRIGDQQYEKQTEKTWGDNEWLEWQADAFAAALLMPKSMTLMLAAAIPGIHNEYWARKAISEMVRTFRVSRSAARVRLDQLGLLSFERSPQYLALEDLSF